MNFPNRTIGQQLLYLKAQSGLSLSAIATAAGYRGASSIQKMFKADYDPATLSPAVLDRLKSAMIGKGSPPLREMDFQFDPDPSADHSLPPAEISRLTREVTRNITVISTGPSAAKVEDSNGAILQTFSLGENLYQYECPVHLRRNWVWGLVVSVPNCSPRYEEGEIVYYKMAPAAKLGDDVLVEFRPVESSRTPSAEIEVNSPHKRHHPCMLARLVGNDNDGVRLEQFSPRCTIQLERDQIAGMYALVGREDFFAKRTYAID